MSFRKKLTLLLILLFLLLLLYFTGTGLTRRGSTEEESSLLFSPKELTSINKIEIPLTDTSLVKEEGEWYVKGTVDGSLYKADQKAVAALFKELMDMKIYAQKPLENGGWREYSSSADVEVSLIAKDAAGESPGSTAGGSSGNAAGEPYSAVIRIGDRVPGTKRRYVTKGEGNVYEADDVLNSVSSTQRTWADLSLFELEFTHSNLISLELVFGKEAEKERIHTIRLERMVSQDRSGTGGWTGVMGDTALQNSFKPEKNKVERLTDTLMHIKGNKYLGRRGSESIESLLNNLVMQISMERDNGSGETLEMYKTVRGGNAVTASNSQENGYLHEPVFSLSEQTKNRILHGAAQLLK